MTRIVVLRLSAMGDVVQGLGAVRALCAYGDGLFDVHQVVQRPFAPLLWGIGLASVIEHDRHGGPLAWWSTLRRIRALRPDVVLDLQGNWKSGGLALGAGAARTIGPARELRREAGSVITVRERITPRGVVGTGAAHPAKVAVALARAVVPELEVGPPRLVATAEELAAEAAALEALGIDPRCPFRVLVEGPADDLRAWPRSALEREARLPGPPALAVAGPAEAGETPPRDVPRIVHLPGQVRRLVALGALCAASGGSVLGPDKGATHVLAATGAATLCLHGPTTAARSGPPAAASLRAVGAPSCAPCRRRACRNPVGAVCMDFTTAEAGLEPVLGEAFPCSRPSPIRGRSGPT